MKLRKKRWKLLAGIVAVLVMLGIMPASGVIAVENDTCTFQIDMPDAVTHDDPNAYVKFWGDSTKYEDGDSVTLPLNQNRQWTFTVNGRTGPPKIHYADCNNLVITTADYCEMEVVIPDITGNPTVTLYNVPGSFQYPGGTVILPVGDEVAWYLKLHNRSALPQWPNKLVDCTPLVITTAHYCEMDIVIHPMYQSSLVSFWGVPGTYQNGDKVSLSMGDVVAWYLDEVRQYPNKTVDCTPLVIGPTNQPPVANANGPYNVDEGGAVPLNGSGSDPDGDPLTYSWDLDNDGTFETQGQSVTFSAAGRDGPETQTVVLKVCDDKDACTMSYAAVNITNVAPTIDAITAPSEPVNINDQPVTVGVWFSDPGIPDTHDVTWDWGGQQQQRHPEQRH